MDDAIAVAFKRNNVALLEILLHNLEKKKHGTPFATLRCVLHHAVRYDVPAILRAIMFYGQRSSAEVEMCARELQNGIPILLGLCLVAK